ncbi:MAG TPA: polysaccharide biosynthesis C-terminal domain-containing protein [Tepidisphaeraceae bacterium]|jgi:O-antigen/teichoic acid export membrane protein|nr:polysaccharide biosynthesis C-terminal domain-containing protein [Tepidisphaeraceae bacterium]
MRSFSDMFDAARKSPMELLGDRSGWALADQVLISLTNFVTMILVAKGLHDDTAAFGTFTLIYSALLFANILQFALVTQPHNVLGSARTGEDYCVFTTTTALVQVVLALTLTVIASFVAAGAHLSHASFTPQLIALVPSIFAWQLQEFVRRVLYTEGRLAGAFVNDLLSYGGQTLIIAFLYKHNSITGEKALWALAITSAVACALGIFQILPSLRPHISKQVIAENWNFGKWLLGSETVQWCSSLQMYLYLAALIIGTSASGMLRAAQILFGPARLLSFFFQNVLPIRFSRALAEHGDGVLGVQLRRAFVLVAVLMGPYCLVLALFPAQVLRLIGPSYADHPRVLTLYSIQALLSYFAMVVTAALSARRMTRDIFTSSVCGSAIALALSWPLIKFMNVRGAVACMMISTSVMTALLIYRYRHRNRNIAPGFPPILTPKEQACAS